MKDLPVFTTEHGAASLVLREIPYRGIAYVRIRATEQPRELIADCVSFCRAVGAERIYAAGHPALEEYPFHTAVLSMCCMKEQLPDTDAALFPVQEATAERFRELYNQKVLSVPNGAWMDGAACREMLNLGDGYFVHRGGKLLGIGRVLDPELRFLAAVEPGAGRDVLCALSHAVHSERITLEVASTNTKALRLYESLGFLTTGELSRWYQIF